MVEGGIEGDLCGFCKVEGWRGGGEEGGGGRGGGGEKRDGGYEKSKYTSDLAYI